MNGFICVDKPSGPSSFSAVRFVRKALGIKKAGHAGTLDPMASGLLVVALGNCTRLLEYLTLEPKVYEFGVTFGKSTDTLDAEGNVTTESDIVPTEEQLIGALKNFAGDIEQIPPQYSAIKIDGKRAYDLARKGALVEMKSRLVTIYGIDMRGYHRNEKRADFTVSCSAGTYVRSLARDIVKAADAGAECFVDKLRRTRTGRFDLSAAVSLDFLNERPAEAIGHIVDTANAFDISDTVIVTDQQKKELSYGRAIVVDNKKNIGDILIAFDGNGALASVLKRATGNFYRPQKNFL